MNGKFSVPVGSNIYLKNADSSRVMEFSMQSLHQRIRIDRLSKNDTEQLENR